LKSPFFMRFEAWESFYIEILGDFGFTRKRDEEAAELLSELLSGSVGPGGSLGKGSGKEPLERVTGLIKGRTAVVCGNAPSLSSDLSRLGEEKDSCFIAADGASAVLLKRGNVPDVVVTDLDGDPSALLEASRQGSAMVVHAHGDNLDALMAYVPHFREPLGTTQSRPFGNVHNFGGFTDGDRCVFLARSLGASKVKLIGFDFYDPRVTPRKAKKLLWAKRLIDLALAED
jgi:uncharacterized Rossmann fold enzyme